jgi:acetyltransferase
MDANNLQLHSSGRSVTIRPIRISDEAIEAEFVRRLSPLSKHYRFFGGVRELSPQAVKAFCHVDGHNSMAFIATLEENGQETQIGVSRFAPNNNEDVRERAVTVADDWQDKGLGKLLCEKLIAFAKDHGVKKLYSIELADNWAMSDLARDLGMSAKRDPEDATHVIYSRAR